MRYLAILQTVIHLTVYVEANKAFLEIILYEINQDDGRYLIRKREINGIFSNFGTANRAEGDIIQMHPHTLCEDSDSQEKYEYGWVGVVKLPFDLSNACHAAEKARAAVEKGATAVIFDISDHPGAMQMLNEHSFNSLNQPIVLVNGGDATKLMDIIQQEQIARAVIKRGEPDRETFGGGLRDPALLLSVMAFVIIAIAFLFCRTKCRKIRQQRSLQNWMLNHSKRKKYRTRKHGNSEFDSNTIRCYQSSVSSTGSLCAICLDAFMFGEDLRVLQCQHEFHVNCIDLWLEQKRSCPLCNRSFSGDRDKADCAIHSSSSTENPTPDSWDLRVEPVNRTPGSNPDGRDSPLRVETIAQSHEPVSRGGLHLLRHASASSTGDSANLSRTGIGGMKCTDSSHSGCERQISQRTIDTHKPFRVNHRTINNESLQACSFMERGKKDSYYLRVEGYPVPHVLNEDCERVSVSSQSHNLIESPPILNLCLSENSTSSNDNVSVLAQMGSFDTLRCGRQTSPSSNSILTQAECYSDFLEMRDAHKREHHRLTPCIEYSSSDGTGNLRCQSYSTLEDALADVSEY